MKNCYYVDVEFVMYPIPEVKTITFLDEFVYMYRLGRQGQSMTLEKMRQNHRNHERVLKSLLRYYRNLKARDTDREYLIYLEKGIANVLSSHFKIYLSFPCSARVCRRLRRMDGTIRADIRKSIMLSKINSYGPSERADICYTIRGILS